jgi:hypothetical protein
VCQIESKPSGARMGADMVAEFPGRLLGGDDQRYGQPTPGAGASTTSTSPVLVLMTFSML